MAKIRSGNFSFEMFFDRAKVLQRLQAKEQRVFEQTGAYGFKVVRNSMRDGRKAKKPKPSAPGKPPKAWVGRLKRGIHFSPTPTSVVIGATPNRGKNTQQSMGAPQVLEEGGVVSVIEFAYRRPDGSLSRRPGRQGKRVKTGQRSVKIKARPYVGPASINYPKILKKFTEKIERNKLL